VLLDELAGLLRELLGVLTELVNGSRKLLMSMVMSFRWWSLSCDRQAVGDLSRTHRAPLLCPMTINLRTGSGTAMGPRSGVPQRCLVSTGR
jgi:hypothetical protein